MPCTRKSQGKDSKNFGAHSRLRWDQVDWQANLIRLEKRQTKTKQARNAPLYGELRAFLEMAYDNTTAARPSFPGRG